MVEGGRIKKVDYGHLVEGGEHICWKEKKCDGMSPSGREVWEGN
jgi:hypothetical protein